MSIQKATFAGGCFWCMVEPFDEQRGIIDIKSGYTGGWVENPTYEMVCEENTGHYEAVQITFDNELFPYEQLLDIFWRQIDPTDEGGQFYDRGHSYKTAIFYHDEKQKELALKSKESLGKSGRFTKPIVTEILPAKPFYLAEDNHQDYYKKNPFHYRHYKQGSGRAKFIQETWKKQYDKNELKEKLSPIAYKVTQENGTEPPFNNPYWNNEAEGIYVDVISGAPLFSSLDQYDAGCGWPSFTKPIDKTHVKNEMDYTHGMTRVEVRSLIADAHLGHVFDDGPKEEGGLRYCINSAALRFIPKDQMEEEGYQDYLYLFNK